MFVQFRLPPALSQFVCPIILACWVWCSAETLQGQESKKEANATRPNIVFVFSDDHALNAISSYGGRLKEIAPTPNIDRLAKEGAIFRNSFCANSICGPSRACILTGKHSHVNGFMNNGNNFDARQWTVAKALKASGYTTAVVGKWHLKSDPVGFDHWEVLPGQGNYYNPDFLRMDGTRHREQGYCTDIVTDKAIDWLESRDESKPFLLMCQHKAPHRTFSPALKNLGAFDDVEIPEPATLRDQYENRSQTLKANEMSLDKHFDWMYDLKLRKNERNGVTLPGPDRYGSPEYNRMNKEQKAAWDAHFGPLNREFLKQFSEGKLSEDDVLKWKYQRYMKNYLGTVKSVDESLGRILKYLDDHQLSENTVVIYSSDQGFYLGEHGWYDKRWMFEESLQMPFLIRWPGVLKEGSRPEELIQNIDYAPTFLEMAGLEVPEEVQGRSLVPILKGDQEIKWRDSIYYAYYEVGEHNVPQHFGVRTQTHKLMYFPNTKEWNLFDLVKDPEEMQDVYEQPSYLQVREKLTEEFRRLRQEFDAPEFAEE